MKHMLKLNTIKFLLLLYAVLHQLFLMFIVEKFIFRHIVGLSVVLTDSAGKAPIRLGTKELTA